MLDSCKLTIINNCEYGSARGKGCLCRVPYMWGFICVGAVGISVMRCTMHSNKLSSTITSFYSSGKECFAPMHMLRPRPECKTG